MDRGKTKYKSRNNISIFYSFLPLLNTGLDCKTLPTILLFVYMGPMETEISNLFLQTTILLLKVQRATLCLVFQAYQFDPVSKPYRPLITKANPQKISSIKQAVPGISDQLESWLNKIASENILWFLIILFSPLSKNICLHCMDRKELQR